MVSNSNHSLGISPRSRIAAVVAAMPRGNSARLGIQSPCELPQSPSSGRYQPASMTRNRTGVPSRRAAIASRRLSLGVPQGEAYSLETNGQAGPIDGQGGDPEAARAEHHPRRLDMSAAAPG